MRYPVAPRVCLITPGHLSTNPRLVKEADTLSAAGYDVRVVAADYLGWARNADAEFQERAWTLADRVKFGPSAPLLRRLRQGLRFRLANKLFHYGVSITAVVNAAWHPAMLELIHAALKVPAELYVAHYPAALPAAAEAARRYGGRYAFDAEDFHLGDVPDEPAYKGILRMTRAIEERYLHGAAYLTAASPEIADAYADCYGVERPTVVLNTFPLAEGPSAPTPSGTALPGPSLYWFSQTIGPDRGLETAIAAIAVAKSKPHLHLLGQPAKGFQEMLLSLAQTFGCADRLHFRPPAPSSHMVRLAATFDIGLASEIGHTLNRERALTNKLFTYLLAGIPAMVSDTSAQSQFARGAKSCLFLYPRSHAAALAAGLDNLLLSPGYLEAARVAAFNLGRTRYNWDFESQRLLAQVAAALPRDKQTRGPKPCASH
jgi:hypothetical protein